MFYIFNISNILLILIKKYIVKYWFLNKENIVVIFMCIGVYENVVKILVNILNYVFGVIYIVRMFLIEF